MSKRLQLNCAPEVPAASLANRATDAVRLGRFKDAIELLKRLIKQDPSPEWRTALADAYAGRAGTGGQGNVQGGRDRPRQYRGDGWNRQGAAAPSAMPDPSRPVSESGGACFPIRRNWQGFRFGSTAIGRAGCSLVACCSDSAGGSRGSDLRA